MGVDTKWLAKHFEEQEVRMSDKTLIDYTDEAVLARQNIAPNAACDIDGEFYDIRNLVFLAQTQADRIEQLAAINEALIAERDEAWKRAAHAEKMWGKAEVKLSESEALLAKALLIIEAYGDDEGYIPKRVVHLWNELTGGKDE